MMARLKDTGNAVVGFVLVLALLAAPVIMILGSLWVAEHFLPFLFAVSWLTLLVVTLVLLPITVFRKTRQAGASAIFFSSWVFGVTLWLWGFALTYLSFGWLGIVVGVIFMGVGVVPIGMFAALLHGEWSILFQLVVMLVLTFGTRVGGAIVADSAAESAAELATEASAPNA